MKKPVTCTALCLALAGCGSAYVAPSSSVISDMTIANASNNYAAVAVFENPQECYKSHIASRLDPGKTARVSLPAEQIVAVHFQQLGFTGGSGLEVGMCDLIATFKPKAGHRYFAQMANTTTQCEVRILDASGAITPVPVVYRQATPPKGFTNKWCPALTDQQVAELR